MPRITRGWIFVVLASVCLAVSAGGAEPKPLWMAVGCDELLKPLQPLVEHRRAEGFETLLSSRPVEDAIAAVPRRPDFLLLVGDDEPGKEDEPWYLPAKRKPLYRWREVQRKTFASDAAWGDLDGDDVPDAPVGRIPARTAREVSIVVGKIIAFERRPPDPTDLQLLVWAGSPEYGPAVDAVATNMLLGMLDTTGPKWLDPWIISSNPNHALCGWPPEQAKVFTQKMKTPHLATVLMGHASADSFFSMTHRGERILLATEDARAQLSRGPPTPPVFFFSCNSGDFARPRACMAESLLLLTGGPVAAVAATTESHPLTNTYTSIALLEALDAQERRLGSIWLDAQKRAAKMHNFLIDRLLRDVEGKLEDQIDVARLRRDQFLMYALLGDPATKLRLPEPLEVKIERTETGWHWQVDRPAGVMQLYVSQRPDKLPIAEMTLDKPPTSAEAAWQAFEEANARLGYKRLAVFTADRPWQGTVDKPGRLRLVAVGPKALHAAAVVIK